MYNPKIQPNHVLENKDTALIFPMLIIAAIIFVGGLSIFYLADDTNNPFKEMYLMPWVFLVGIVIAAPNFYLIYKGRFNFFHPLVFAAWSLFYTGVFSRRFDFGERFVAAFLSGFCRR